MKLLYGMGNPAKLSSMKKKLKKLEIELIGLKDLNCEIPDVPETGKTPLENARIKALAYYHAFHIPVFSCDFGLYCSCSTFPIKVRRIYLKTEIYRL